MATYKHLTINREQLNNARRTRKAPPPRKLDDLRGHGQKLNAYFANAKAEVQKQNSSKDGATYILKISYEGALNFNHLNIHGLEFVSHEGRELCVVFATEEGLAKFQEHLNKLGVSGESLTYKQVLTAIEGIDSWSAEDRMSWALQSIGLPQTPTFSLDVELWPYHTANHPVRLRIHTTFESWLAEIGVRQVDRINLDSLLMYRVVVNQAQADQLLNHRDVRLVDLIPQTGINFPQLNRDIAELPLNIPAPHANAARVCILDSGINTNHPLLRSAIGESHSFVRGQNEFDEAGHGTAVAGIVLYGDVEACDQSNYWHPAFWLFNAKVMRKCQHSDDAVFDEHSVETTLTNAIEHFVGLGCRIFNLSLGNSNAPYDGLHVRGLAYILDVLARKHNVLFVVSTGNFRGSENPTVPVNSWREEYPEYLLNPQSVIIDPAPALNVLTVGSVARHNATVDSQKYPDIHQLSPAGESQPSPFTRHGPSVKGALKPELIAPGGNLASPMRRDGEQWDPSTRGLGVLTLNNDFQGNTVFKEISGTSFSAPYITHLAGRLLNEYPEASANLLRAMLVNHAYFPAQVESTFSDEMKKAYHKDKATWQREIARDVGGYGQISDNDLFRSSDHCVVLMCEEAIERDSSQFYELPLPPSFLRSSRGQRELSITLAYTPAVRTTRIEYVATQISYRLVKGDSLEAVQKSFNHAYQKDEATRNDDMTGNRDISAQLRSKGTVQSSRWTFKQRNPKEKWFVVVTRSDRDWNHPDVLDKEQYALVVTVADRDNEEAQLYTQIETVLAVQAKARNQAQLEARQRATG